MLKSILSLLFLLLMAGIVGTKINSIHELTSAGWIALYLVIALGIAFALGIDNITVHIPGYAKLKDNTRQWIAASISIAIVIMLGYVALSSEKVRKLIFVPADTKDTIVSSKRIYKNQKAHNIAPLTDAYRKGDMARFRRLIRNGADPDTRIGVHTLLSRSIQDHRYAYARELINSGADVNAFAKRLDMQETKAIYRLKKVDNMSKKMENDLEIKRKAIIDKASNGYISYPPLYYAVRENAVEIVKLLLEHDARMGGLTKMSVDGIPLLEYARAKGYREVLDLVFKKMEIK